MIALGNKLEKRTAAAAAAVVLLLTALLGIALPQEAEAASQPFTVYLQAGHSPSAYGVGNIKDGMKEAVLNEQVTIRTYNALRAKGINVLLLNPITLDSSLPSVIKQKPSNNQQYSYYSPEPAMLTALTWPERFDASLKSQADLCISLHHNGYHDSSIRGYEIYYASTVGGDYGRTTADVEGSKRLAKLVEAEFQKGFHVPPRSPAVRDSTTNNGLTKSAPMPTILIEAGYMSNSADLAACRSEANQQSMADKIANAVVNYKNNYWTGSDANASSGSSSDYVDIRATSLTATYAESDETITVSAALTPADAVSKATMRVWPESDGTEAGQTYTLTNKGNGQYSARIGLEPFKFASGTYNITVSAVDHAGRSQATGTAHVTVPASTQVPTAGSVTADLLSPTSDAAVLTVKDPQAKSGVDKVEFAVWSNTNGQDDLKWYTAQKTGSSWVVTMRTSDLLDRPGEYTVHAYVTDTRGTRQVVGSTTVNFRHKEGDIPELRGNVTYRKVGTKLVLTASDVRDNSGVRSVRFALWSAGSNQKDMKWYDGRQSGTSWSAVISLPDHPSSDNQYTTHVYATDENDNDGCICAMDFRVGSDSKAPTAKSVTVVEKTTGVATAVVDDVKDDCSGVSSVDIAVWTQKNNQDDLRWYKAVQDASGAWTADFRKADHGSEDGPYHVVAYATDAAKNRGLAGRTKFTFTGVSDAAAPSGGTVQPDKKTYTVQTAVVDVKGLKDPSGVSAVTVEVSQEKGNAVKEYAAKEQNGTWSAGFSWSRDFVTSGTYVIRAYATDRAGNKGLVGETKVTVDPTAIGGYLIMGESKATVAQLVNAQLAKGWSNGWYGMTVEQFCQKYYDICEAEGVRAEVAYAQMMHETGSLKFGNLVERYQKNFAGLGSTGLTVAADKQKSTHRYTSDGKDAGIVFRTVEDGIKSQIQHLKGYASTEALKLPMAAEYDRFGFIERGCAPTLHLLSTKWATDTEYGVRIQKYAEDILAQSTKMPKIDTKIPSVIEADQKPAAATAAPTASATAKPGKSGEAAFDMLQDEKVLENDTWVAPDPAALQTADPDDEEPASAEAEITIPPMDEQTEE